MMHGEVGKVGEGGKGFRRIFCDGRHGCSEKNMVGNM